VDDCRVSVAEFRILNHHWFENPSMRDPIGVIFLVKDAVVVAVGIGTAIAVGYRLRGSRHWPMTHGKVEFCEARNEQGTTWTIHIYYSFAVGGDYYSGQHLLRVRNEHLADESVGTLKGQAVTVRYSPSNPATCVLLPSDQMSSLAETFKAN
jgi:uncharacterized protein DUF3592